MVRPVSDQALKIRMLVVEHRDRHRASLARNVAAEMERTCKVKVEAVECSDTGDAVQRLATSRFDVVLTDWLWPPEAEPDGDEKYDRGSYVASVAKDEGVACVVVVTRERDAGEQAEAHESVDLVLLWEQLSDGPSAAASAICRELSKRDQRLATIAPQEVEMYDQRTVFVIYGHDHDSLDGLTKFLEDLDLLVLSFDDARNDVVARFESESAGRPVTTYDVVEAATTRSSAVLCLLTGDERSHLAADPNVGFLRPRPNVIFEAGLAFARKPTRTLLVKVGLVDDWSDLDGVQYAVFSDDEKDKERLVGWLQGLGLPVNERKRDWRTTSYLK